MSLADQLTDMIPDERATPEKRHRWRKRISLVGCSAWLALFVVIVPALVMLFFTGAPLIGRVAYADETDTKMNKKISEAVAPLRDSIQQIDGNLKTQGALISKLVSASTAAQICKTVVRRNKEGDEEERRRLAEQLRVLKIEYMHHAGVEFDVRDC